MFNSAQGYLPRGRTVAKYNHGEVAAGTTISHGGSTADFIRLLIKATGGAGVTMNATPTIQAGSFDGQVCILEMDRTSTQLVTLTDESSVAGTKLRLTAAPTTLLGGARDTYAFMWNAEEGMWWSILGGRVNPV